MVEIRTSYDNIALYNVVVPVTQHMTAHRNNGIYNDIVFYRAVIPLPDADSHVFAKVIVHMEVGRTVVHIDSLPVVTHEIAFYSVKEVVAYNGLLRYMPHDDRMWMS